jgi:hypothetical protein
MTSNRAIRLFVGAGTLLALAGHALAEDRTVLAERLHRAIVINSIDDPHLNPWHLKLSFQLFDDKGQATEKGEIEEWWASPTAYKTVYASPSYTHWNRRTDSFSTCGFNAGCGPCSCLTGGSSALDLQAIPFEW